MCFLCESFSDLNYILECHRIEREGRLPICYFWRNIVGDPDKVYQDFEEKICNINTCEGNHKYWCLYHKPLKKCWDKLYSDHDKMMWEKVRKGVKNLGKALHEECHNSLELTQNRLIGAGLKIGKYKGKHEKDIERFRRHYYEFGYLKAAFISEINLRESKKSTHSDIAIFSGSALIAIVIASFTTKDLQTSVSHAFWALEIIFLLALVIASFFSFRESIKYNEAKDAFYICVGVDVDNRNKSGGE